MGALDGHAGGLRRLDERDPDAHDHALLCSYTHPDAGAEDLDTVTDWYTWVFFFDDHFLELFKRTQDREGAKACLDRLPAYLPEGDRVEGELHNAVLVVQSFFDCAYPTAVGIVAGLMRSRLWEFHHVVSEQLQVFLDDPGLDARSRAGVARWVRDLQHWIAGVVHWHAETRRYPAPELLARFGGGLVGTGGAAFPPGPTGLGTASLLPNR